MLIILESIAISLLKYSSRNNNKFYVLSGICYLLIVYILYHLFKVEKVVTSFALWNIGAILFAYIILRIFQALSISGLMSKKKFYYLFFSVQHLLHIYAGL